MPYIPEHLWFRYKGQFFNLLFFLFILSVCPVHSYHFQSSFHFQRLCKHELPWQLHSFSISVSQAEKQNAEAVFNTAKWNVSGTVLWALRPAGIKDLVVHTTMLSCLLKCTSHMQATYWEWPLTHPSSKAWPLFERWLAGLIQSHDSNNSKNKSHFQSQVPKPWKFF